MHLRVERVGDARVERGIVDLLVADRDGCRRSRVFLRVHTRVELHAEGNGGYGRMSRQGWGSASASTVGGIYRHGYFGLG